MYLHRILLLFSSFLLSTLLAGQADLDWLRQFGSGDDDYATDAVVAANGDIISLGVVVGGPANREGISLGRWTPDGDNIYLRTINNGGAVLEMYGVELDDQENIVVAGNVSNDALVRMYDGDGQFLHGDLDRFALYYDVARQAGTGRFAVGGTRSSRPLLRVYDDTLGVVWEQIYDLDFFREVVHVEALDDGGFALLCPSNGPGGGEVGVIVTDPEGNLIWSRRYGGSGIEYTEVNNYPGCSLRQTRDGNLVFGATTASADGDVNKPDPSIRGDFLWIAKIDIVTSDLLWNTTTLPGACTGVLEKLDGDLLVFGQGQLTASRVPDHLPPLPDTDHANSRAAYATRVSADGIIQGHIVINGDRDDYFTQFINYPDGNLIGLGATTSREPPFLPNSGRRDFFLARLDDGTVPINDPEPSTVGQLPVDLCPGETFTLGGETFDENRLSDTVILTGQADDGGDSLVFVQVTLLPLLDSVLVATLCPGATLTVLGNTFPSDDLPGVVSVPPSDNFPCGGTILLEVTLLPADDVSCDDGGDPGNNDPEYDCPEEGSPYCASQESGFVGTEQCVRITANNYDSLLGFQTALVFDPARLAYRSLRPAPALPLDTIHYTEVHIEAGVLTLSYSQPSGEAISLPDGEELFSVCFTSLVGGRHPVLSSDTIIGQALVIFDDGERPMTVNDGSITAIACTDTTVTVSDTICAGDTYSFGDLNLTQAGVYDRTLDTEAGCDSTIILTLTVTEINFELPAEIAFCPGADRIVEGPDSIVFGLASTPRSQFQPRLMLTPGVNEVRISRVGSDCVRSQQVTAIELPAPEVNVVGELAYCGEDAGAMLTVSGGETYDWSSGDTTATVVLPVGTYTVTVTDARGCTDTASATVRLETEAPEFVFCPQDVNGFILPGDDGTVVEWPEPLAEDNCGSGQLLVESNFSSGDLFPEGTTEVIYEAVDAAGNTARCAFNVLIEPTDELTFYIDSAAVTLEQPDLFCVPVLVENYNEVVAFQIVYALPNVDGAEFQSVELGADLAPLAENGSFQAFVDEDGNLRILFANSSGLGLTVEDATSLLTIKIRIPGEGGDCFPVTPNYEVIDVLAFREGPGRVVPTVLGGAVCYPREVDITGRIYKCNFEDQPIAQADVDLAYSDGVADFDITDVAGRYGFTELPYGLGYVVRPERDFEDNESLDIFDLIILIRHIRAISFITDPCLQIAADVDQSGRIDVLDLPEIERLAVGLINEFTNNTSWQFVPASFEFDGPAILSPYPQEEDLPALTRDTVVDFIGIKIGDLDQSASGQLWDGGPQANDQMLRTTLRDLTFHAGDRLTIPVHYAPGQPPLSAFQQSVSFDPEVLAFTGHSGDRTGLVLNAMSADKGQLAMIWVDHSVKAATAAPVTAGSVLYQLTFTALSDGQLSESLLPASPDRPALAAGADLRSRFGLSTEFLPVAEAATSLSVVPNPVAEVATLRFSFEREADWTVEVINALGVRTFTRSGRSTAGTPTTLQLDGTELPVAGTYLVILHTKDGRYQVRKISRR